MDVERNEADTAPDTGVMATDDRLVIRSYPELELWNEFKLLSVEVTCRDGVLTGERLYQRFSESLSLFHLDGWNKAGAAECNKVGTGTTLIELGNHECRRIRLARVVSEDHFQCLKER